MGQWGRAEGLATHGAFQGRHVYSRHDPVSAQRLSRPEIPRRRDRADAHRRCAGETVRVRRVQRAARQPIRRRAPAPPGGFFNYDLVGAHDRNGTGASALLEAGTFGPFGTAVTRFLERKTAAPLPAGVGNDRAVRAARYHLDARSSCIARELSRRRLDHRREPLVGRRRAFRRSAVGVELRDAAGARDDAVAFACTANRRCRRRSSCT